MPRDTSPIKAWGGGEDDFSSDSSETSSTSTTTSYTSSSGDERDTRKSYYRATSDISVSRSQRSKMSAMSLNSMKRRGHPTSDTSSECTFAPRITKMGRNSQRCGTLEDRMYYDEMSVRQERKRESDALLKAHEKKQLEDFSECTFRPRILDDTMHRDRRTREAVFSDLWRDAKLRTGCKQEIERLRRLREETLLKKASQQKYQTYLSTDGITESTNRLFADSKVRMENHNRMKKERDREEASQKVQPKGKVQKVHGKLPWNDLYEKGLAKQQKRNTNDIPGSAWREFHKRIPNNQSFGRLYYQAEKQMKALKDREEASPEPLPYTFKPTIKECPARIKKERAAFQQQKELEEKQVRLNEELKFFEKQAKKQLVKKKKKYTQPGYFPGYEQIDFNSVGDYQFLSNCAHGFYDVSQTDDASRGNISPVDFDLSAVAEEGGSMQSNHLTPNRSPSNRPPIHPPPQIQQSLAMTDLSSEDSHPDNVTDEDISD